jgi:menaquinone-dependent protoporphyrinogen oxidase
MKPVLVAYATNAGSTEAVAAAVGEELRRGGTPVDVRRIHDVSGLNAYGAVIVGGPMIFGAWHREAVDFVIQQQQALRHIPMALFVTALHLVRTADPNVTVPVYYDPALATPPRQAGRLSFTERYSTVEWYLAPVLSKAPLIKPLSVAFFGGKMDHRALTLPKRLFAQIVIRKPGDFRNWPAIRAWAADMRRVLLQEETAVPA